MNIEVYKCENCNYGHAGMYPYLKDKGGFELICSRCGNHTLYPQGTIIDVNGSLYQSVKGDEPRIDKDPRFNKYKSKRRNDAEYDDPNVNKPKPIPLWAPFCWAFVIPLYIILKLFKK